MRCDGSRGNAYAASSPKAGARGDGIG